MLDNPPDQIQKTAQVIASPPRRHYKPADPCAMVSYRDILIGDRANVRLIYFKGEETLIARRFAARHETIMPRALLPSQFEAFEEPGLDEKPITISIEPKPREIVAQILSAMNMAKDALPDRLHLQPSGTHA